MPPPIERLSSSHSIKEKPVVIQRSTETTRIRV